MTTGLSVGAITTLSEMPSSALIETLKARGIAIDSSGTEETLHMKTEDVRRIQRLQSEKQRFEATANGIILGSLGKKGWYFRSFRQTARNWMGFILIPI